MSPLRVAASLRILPRTPNPLRPAAFRTFHPTFVPLNASSPLTTPPSPAAPIYEKQDESSSEPHLSSSGTRTYVVSEPDPSDTPFQVPSGAYPASASYEAGVGGKVGVENTAVPGDMSRRGATTTRPGKL